MLINFGFEEVNEAVIRNAQIWRYKKVLNGKEKIHVLTPEVFANLYFHADKIITFNPKDIKSYSAVSDFIPGKSLLRLYSLFERAHRFLFKISQLRNISYFLFQRTPRQDRFFILSGLQKKLLEICRKKFGRVKYLRMSDYYDLSLMSPVLPNLSTWHKTNHEYIHQMISAGDVYRVRQTHNDLMTKPTIILRTRNFKNKAVVHNSKKSIFAPLITELLNFDCKVINIGTPHLPLDIAHPNYQEFTHNMSISDEFEFCGKASCAIMTTEAGMFLGFASTDIRIVQFDEEIFERCFNMSLSFFDARKKAKLDDLDIRQYVQSNSWKMATKLIYEFAINEHQKLENSSNFRLPERIDLGMI